MSNEPLYLNAQSILRSYVYLGQFTDAPMEGGVLPRTYDLYMIAPPSATALEEVHIYARFGIGYEDKLMGTLKRDHTVTTRTPLDEAAKRAIKHLFTRGKKS